MKTLEILDVCYPDYFSGYHRPVISVSVYNNMTFADLAQGIKDEINSIYDYFTTGDNCFTKTEMLIVDEYIKTLEKTSQAIFIDNTLENSENDEFCIYAYLSICKPVYNNGIKFLS